MATNNTTTILLIEDNAEMAENICSILKLVNYKVLYAVDGKSGVALAKLERPDLILCDIMMPELDGFGVLHILSKDPELVNIPFIFLTAKSDSTDIRNGMNLGADDYITKPFDGLDLLKVIEVRLKKSEMLKQKARTDDFLARIDADRLNGTNGLEKLPINRNVRSFRRKELIYMEGQAAFDLYYVVNGSIKTYKNNYEGKELITGFFTAGNFFGYIPLLEDTSHHESAEVLEDAEVSIIPKQDFLDVIYSSKHIAKTFIRLLSSNLINVENRLVDIAYQSVRQRVAGALIKINQGTANEKTNCVITVTRKDMSNLIGTATESLNRTLADFKEEGLIEIRDDGIRILDRTKLERNCKQIAYLQNRVGRY